MSYETILLEIKVQEAVGIITLNRPKVRNAINQQMMQEIRQALAELREREEVKVVIFTGAGEKSFAAGADIAALRERTFIEALAPAMSGLYAEIEHYEKPTIAAVNGYALGGGCELALACDLRIAAPQAKLGLTELSFGIIPAAGGTQRLTRLVGQGKAKELIFTGEMLTAEEAVQIGLVNHVVPQEELLEKALGLARKMANKGPLALRLAKVVINQEADVSLQAGLVMENLAQSVLYTTEDKYEGTTAFLEKRTAKFKGR